MTVGEGGGLCLHGREPAASSWREAGGPVLGLQSPWELLRCCFSATISFKCRPMGKMVPCFEAGVLQAYHGASDLSEGEQENYLCLVKCGVREAKITQCG